MSFYVKLKEQVLIEGIFVKKKFYLIFIFYGSALLGMERVKRLHPDFSVEEANNIHNFLRKELKEPYLTVDFPHILTPYFAAQNSKSLGFHLANSLPAQKIITFPHDIDLSNGCYQGTFLFQNKAYTSTFFPERWSYADFAHCLLSLLKYGNRVPDERNKKRQIIRGPYKDTTGAQIHALMVFDKDNKKVVATYPIVDSPKVTNKSQKNISINKDFFCSGLPNKK